jgi:hypothetical protein
VAQDGAVSTASPPPAAPARSSLRVTVWAGPGQPPATWTLTDDPPGGDHPDPAGACAALAAATRPFDPVPPGTMCAQLYGGPQTATIDGNWHGVPVHATYSRVDACEIGRWKALAAVFRAG